MKLLSILSLLFVWGCATTKVEPVSCQSVYDTFNKAGLADGFRVTDQAAGDQGLYSIMFDGNLVRVLLIGQSVYDQVENQRESFKQTGSCVNPEVEDSIQFPVYKAEIPMSKLEGDPI